MALKFRLIKGSSAIDDQMNKTASIHFFIKDNTSEGQFKEGIEQNIKNFPITTWPATPTALKTEVVAKIVATYPGATEV